MKNDLFGCSFALRSDENFTHNIVISLIKNFIDKPKLFHCISHSYIQPTIIVFVYTNFNFFPTLYYNRLLLQIATSKINVKILGNILFHVLPRT